MNSAQTDRSDRLIVACITVAAAWLRLMHIGQPSLWWDEFITVGASLPPLTDMLSVLKNLGPTDIGVELFPPLAHVITHGLTLIGHNDVLMRLPGVLAGVACVPVTYLLCRKTLGRLSAIAAALLLALSVYHLHFSREVRPYSLFMLENLLALHFLHSALAERRDRLFWAYAAVVAAMLYTSYMAATLVFSQVLFAAVVLGGRFASGERRAAWSQASRLGLALALAGAAYLPWVAGQLNVYNLLHDPGFKANFSLDFVSSSLKEYAAFAFRGDFPAGWTLAGLGLVGCVAALAGGRRRFVLLMVLWAFMPVVGIFLAKARMELTSRYIFPVFFFLLIFTAHLLATAVGFLADRLFGKANPIFFARLTAVGVLGIFLSQPNLESLSEYYSRETSHYKELAAYLIGNRNNQDTILYFNPRNLKLIFDWYGGQALRDARNLPDAGYHRALFLAPEAVHAPKKFPQAVWRTRIEDTDIMSLGIARTPVRPMIPDASGRYVYSDDFSGFRMIEDAYSAANLVPSPLAKALTRHDAGRPGYAVYRFQAPKSATIQGARLDMEFSTRIKAGIPTDDKAILTLMADGKSHPLATVTLKDFMGPDGKLTSPNHEGKRFSKLSLDLGRFLTGASTFDLRLDCPDATRSGPIQVENFRLEAQLGGSVPGRTALPEALLEQLPVTPWVPGQDLALSEALHAFSLDGAITRAGVGTPKDLEAYLSAHPGAAPVRVLPYPDGTPAVALYDPALADPFLRLDPGRARTLTAFPPTARSVRSVKLAGALDRPVLTLGGAGVSLPVTCPAPAELTVNPGGQGELVFSPLFTRDGFSPSATASFENIRRNEGEDCLSCAEDKPCSLTYAMHSELPATKVRITAFPRVESTPDGRYVVITQVSADHGPWREVNRYRGSGSGRWEGWKIPQYTLVPLNAPARDVRVRFVLTGAKAQLWSSPDAHMRLELRLDASKVPVPSVYSWPANLSLDHASPLSVLLLKDQQTFPDRLRRTR